MKNRKLLTEIFPWLLPVRRWQKKILFYLKMKWDKQIYSTTINDSPLPNKVFEAREELINKNTGAAMVYQENKVHNLQLAAKTLNGIVIKPGETFSFWNLVRYADKQVKYKKGLGVVNGELIGEYGGGLCMMSNLLHWLFLHTNLTVTERKGHGIKRFPDNSKAAVLGVDATVSEGWIDLKATNYTNNYYQIILEFSNNHLTGTVYTDKPVTKQTAISNGVISYEFTKEGEIVELAPVVRTLTDAETGKVIASQCIYVNTCVIGYPLEENIKIKRGEQKNEG